MVISSASKFNLNNYLHLSRLTIRWSGPGMRYENDAVLYDGEG